MTKPTQKPEIFLALSPAGVATALGIRPDEVAEAIKSGALTVRQKGTKRRIAVFGPGGVQEWFQSWPEAKRQRKSKYDNQN